MDDPITTATKLLVPQGFKVFQIFQFADTEDEHVRILLELMNPCPGAQILDVGCGVGQIARLMLRVRADLNFTLVNSSDYQLSLCEGLGKLLNVDLHAIPAADHSFDVVMVGYAAGYAALDVALKEWRRVLKRSGVLYLIDMEGPSATLAQELGYATYSRARWHRILEAHEFTPEDVTPRTHSLNRFYAMLKTRPTLERVRTLELIAPLRPLVWRATR